uniref:Uncharacterized protein n=1 Tax=Hildenbrandia rubra TaxID=31481 RepID=A0A1C9CG90_9FLOR|nr:hypothetical protein Hrub_145 [Hildenbrandia rubra]AOM67389.1 hypothetical protein Hrub_145 [Hildenbrandia rubra]
MQQKLPFLVNLNCLLIALHVLDSIDQRIILVNNSFIHLPNVCESVLYKISQAPNAKIHSTMYTAYIAEYLVSMLSKQQLRIASLVLLLESCKCYPTYNYYLQKYRFFFRKSFIINNVGCYYYDNDQYINIVALINLRVILLCSKTNGAYFFWLYLVHYKYNFPV